jgi:hypothetical protein
LSAVPLITSMTRVTQKITGRVARIAGTFGTRWPRSTAGLPSLATVTT